MKSVLISTRPKWVEKICHKIGEDEAGKAIYEKRIEVRNTAPQEVPFKCYIYETKGQYVKFTHGAHTKYGYGRGKVIGEFICDKVYKIEPIFSFCNYYSGYDDSSDSSYFEDYSIDSERLKKTCLTRQELYIYGKEKTLYGWNISNLRIYGKPKELSEFCIPCKVSCENCKNPLYFECWCEEKGKKIVTRPPQSWCYVEDLGEEE